MIRKKCKIDDRMVMAWNCWYMLKMGFTLNVSELAGWLVEAIMLYENWYNEYQNEEMEKTTKKNLTRRI